jgi:hypothetical protein
MLTNEEAMEIIRTLSALPPDKVAAVRDFAHFLKERYGQPPPVDDSDAWTEEDLQDLTAAALRYAAQTGWSEGERDG